MSQTARLERLPAVSAEFSGLNDAELLHCESDPSIAFAEFYRRHFAAVLRFVASRSVDVDSAADVVSETFMSALSHRRQYRPQYDTARLWLLRIAINKLIDAQRRQAADLKLHRSLHATFELSEEDRADYEQLLTLDEEPALAALADLPPNLRELIQARIIEDRDYADLAQELGLSEAAVRQRVSRGLRQVRKRVEREL